MQITPGKSDGLKSTYRISFPASEIEKRLDARLVRLAQNVKLDGFRKGKVPMAIIKERYGKRAEAECVKALLDEATAKVISDNKLRPATTPSVRLDPQNDAKGDKGNLAAELVVEVMPEIKRVDLAGLAITKPELKIAEAEIDKALANLVESVRGKKPLATPRPAKTGDVLVIDFTGRIDGAVFDGGSAKQQQIKLGSGGFLPEFDKGLVGGKKGETKEIGVKFPADYRHADLAGKAAVFSVTISDILELAAAPALDDAFAKQFGVADVAGLRAAMADEIGKHHAGNINALVRTRVLDALDEAYGEVALPQTLYEREYASICQQFSGGSAGGSADDSAGASASANDSDSAGEAVDAKLSAEDKAEAKRLAKRRIKLGMVLAEIGRSNDIQVTKKDEEQAIQTEAMRYGDPKKVVGFYRKNPKAIERLRGPIIEGKVIAHILQNAKVTPKPMTPDELYKEEGGGATNAKAEKG